jgi:hypothetical protein
MVAEVIALSQEAFVTLQQEVIILVSILHSALQRVILYLKLGNMLAERRSTILSDDSFSSFSQLDSLNTKARNSEDPATDK